MMWDDVVIGSGDKGCSASSAFAPAGVNNVSQNNVSFWIHPAFHGVGGMTIFKNTPEGECLQGFFNAGAPAEDILRHIEQVFLDHVPLKTMNRLMAEIMKREFEAGQRYQQLQFRKALGIY